MNGLIHELTTELKTNPEVKDSAVVRVVLESIHNSILLGVPSDQILTTALSNLDDLATATVNENLKEVVAKFRKMAEKPTKRLQDMAKEAGISLKIKMLKESNIAKDPTFAHTIKQIDAMLAVVPEFRVMGAIFESLNKYAYDPDVAKTLTDINTYVNANRAKLEIMNAIFEMRQTNSIMYNEAITILEESLLEQIYEADAIRMKVRGRVDMPIINRLVNTLSMVEAKNQGKFNIGLGNGDAKVKAVIAPFHKISESSALILLDNSFIKLSDDQDPTSISIEEAQQYPDFFAVCESFARLQFQERDNEIFTRGRNLEIAFSVNETGNLQLKVNGKIIDDLTKMDLSEVFLMEQIDTRANLVKVFNSLEVIVNLEFAKKIINERLDKDSIVFTIGENLFVFEKLGQTRVIKKMQGLAFHNYVMENFHYDVSELYAIELEEREQNLRKIDEEKAIIEKDLVKLEKSVVQLEETLKDASLNSEQQVQLNDLKVSIEKNVNALRNHYITLDQSKKKV
jgi:acetone carboxylase gamma subunit